MKNDAVKNLMWRNGILYSSFTDPSGRQIRRSLKTRNVKLAEIRVRKLMAEAYENGYFNLKRPLKVSFGELAKRVLVYAKDKTKRYKKVYVPTINTLMRYLGDKLLREITKGVVQDVQTRIKEKVSEVNSNNAIRVLRRMFNLAIDWELTDKNPTKGILPYKVTKRKVRFLTAKETEVLLEHCEPYVKDMVVLALHTGMRKGEILNLKWDNVDLDNGLIVLDKTKNNKIREIPMSVEVNNMLVAKSKQNKPSKDSYVFPNPDSEPYRDVAAFRKAVKNANLTGFRFHDLRHSFASQLVMAGVDLMTVKELLGHSEIETTMIYAHLAPKHKREAIAKLETHLDKAKEASSDLLRLTFPSSTKLAQSQFYEPSQN